MSQKIQEFKVGDRVVFWSPPKGREYQNVDIGKVGTVIGVIVDKNFTNFLTVQYDCSRFPKNRRASSFRKLTKLEKALK